VNISFHTGSQGTALIFNIREVAVLVPFLVEGHKSQQKKKKKKKTNQPNKQTPKPNNLGVLFGSQLEVKSCQGRHLGESKSSCGNGNLRQLLTLCVCECARVCVRVCVCVCVCVCV
jgi:hypothetical protein